jgi:hypothetical protein
VIAGLIWLELTCLYNIIYCLFVGDGNGSYILQNLGSSETGSKKARKAKYSIALQYLVLEETST